MGHLFSVTVQCSFFIIYLKLDFHILPFQSGGEYI